MTGPTTEFILPRDTDLGLRRIANRTGLAASLLPNGALFALSHQLDGQGDPVLVNQVLGSPLSGGIGRVLLRLAGGRVVEAVGPTARLTVGAGTDRFVWAGEAEGLAHRVTLWLAPDSNLWLWRVEVENQGAAAIEISAVLLQDIGLGSRGFLMNNEAYASQYMDHHVARHDRLGPVVMSRQALAQGGRIPWVAHGCLDGASGFATDAAQSFGPAFRDRAEITGDLPDEKLQHEVACPAIASKTVRLAPGATAGWSFFGLYVPDHKAASDDGDLAVVDTALAAAGGFRPAEVALETPVRGLLQDAPPLVAEDLDAAALDRLWPSRRLEERDGGVLQSFFVDDGGLNRHVALRAKELGLRRRHGALLRSGAAMLPEDGLLCATVWAHGVFAAQLTVGNTSFHKLFSVSRDPYNITRSSGLRILVDAGEGWRLLSVPSAFEMGLAESRWIYRFGDRVVTVRAAISGADTAMQWRVDVEGRPCRFLVLGHLVLGERELEQAGRVAIDPAAKRFTFRPDPDWLWGQRYPDSVYHLVTPTPEAIEAIGGDELLYADGQGRRGGYIALRTGSVSGFGFAVTGSLTDAAAATALADRYAAGVPIAEMLGSADAHWAEVTRGLRIHGGGAEGEALDAAFPWLAHDAMIHLTVPHGLEQYTGGAWGTRDVCQGALEFLLALEHDGAAKEVLRKVFAQQYADRGDWPQWFMLEPYSPIQDRHAHGDVIVWPLKALCDYVEATGDLAFLDEPIAWRNEDDFTRTERQDPVSAHIDRIVAVVKDRFIPGTHLLRYGEGDWNDSLQPVDPHLRDWMVSAWTVALLIQQLGRWAAVLDHAGRSAQAREIETLGGAMHWDLNRHLMRDGVLAGYAVFTPEGTVAELLLHPSDTRTGLTYSLLPMKRALIAGLFAGEAVPRHLGIIRDHLMFPDGARLMDRPVAYHGGVEQLFRRAESAAYFGREIGLMYTHAHLRTGEALAAHGQAAAVWRTLLLANPVAVTDILPNASPRQRNAYFSSSDAAFADRYAAGTEWQRVKDGTIAVDGGWRVYSSGPGLYTNLLLRHVFGLRRNFGDRVFDPLLPPGHDDLAVELARGGETRRYGPA
ncbi:hypothetical protein [Inquilinus sp.]|jgi:cellobiose phosphorylase|uniref:hypothetical protein n=1 Tax=Inquilinus sp. TaxID=1932117 RepID=UPI0037851876